MNIVKSIAILLLMLVVMLFVGCDTVNNIATSTTSSANGSLIDQNTSEDKPIDPADCTHQYEEKITKQPGIFGEGVKTFSCDLCQSSYTESVPRLEDDNIKILAVGNSLTNDATQYLGEILRNAGVKNYVVGRLFESGCSVNAHWGNIIEFAEVYDYSEDSGGGWVSLGKYSAQMALERTDWDYIVLQETIASVTYESSYKYLGNLVDFISETNPDAKLAWQLMWAYQAETESKYCRYRTKQEQALMYDQIISTYKSYVSHFEEIVYLLPSGTAVQNLRTSYIGDTITTDGLHMTPSHGRYLTALTWFAAFTNGDVDTIDWYPSNYPEVADDLAVIRQSVKDAIQTPLAITEQAKTK